MTWTQLATLIVSIVAATAGGTGVIVLSVNGIRTRAELRSLGAFRAD